MRHYWSLKEKFSQQWEIRRKRIIGSNDQRKMLWQISCGYVHVYSGGYGSSYYNFNNVKNCLLLTENVLPLGFQNKKPLCFSRVFGQWGGVVTHPLKNYLLKKVWVPSPSSPLPFRFLSHKHWVVERPSINSIPIYPLSIL